MKDRDFFNGTWKDEADRVTDGCTRCGRGNSDDNTSETPSDSQSGDCLQHQTKSVLSIPPSGSTDGKEAQPPQPPLGKCDTDAHQDHVRDNSRSCAGSSPPGDCSQASRLKV